MLKLILAEPIKVTLAILITAAAACMYLFALSASAQARGIANIGDPAPDCALKGLDGQVVGLAEAGKGKPVIVHFWSSSCRICVVEMPVMDSLYRQYKDQGLTVYAVNVRQSPEAAKAFAAKYGLELPLVLDRDGSVARQFGVVGLPRTYFVDRSGTIRSKLPGEGSRSVLEKLIKDIL